jgi:DNA invertase Pin-like site-specific DNA recombinase
MSTPTRPRAYSYLRFSTPEQMKGDSLRRQTELAETYARRHSLELDTELNLRDLGVSAFRGKNLETGALGAFRRAIEEGIVEPGSFLLVESLDRVSRQVARKAIRIVEDIVDAGVTVVTLNDGKAYTKKDLDSLDFLMAFLVLFRANEESETKSRRLKAAWHNKREQAYKAGKVLTSIVPKWIELDEQRKPRLIQARAKVVQRIVQDILRGRGKEAIAKALNREGVPVFGRSKHWHKSVIQKLIASPALVGTFIPHTREHRDGKLVLHPQEPIQGYFPAVIDAETYARLRAVLSAPAVRGRHTTRPLQSILSGLSRCPECGALMTRVTRGSARQWYLICTKVRAGAAQHTGHGVRCDAIEGHLMQNYEAILDAMPHPDAEVQRQLDNAQTAADALEDRIRELLELVERRPSDALAARIAALEGELKVAREELSQCEERASLVDRKALKLRMDALGVAIRARPLDRARINAALRELVGSVTVDYRTGHLVFKWRSGGESSSMFMWPKEARA